MKILMSVLVLVVVAIIAFQRQLGTLLVAHPVVLLGFSALVIALGVVAYRDTRTRHERLIRGEVEL